jgi:hypothetical protein
MHGDQVGLDDVLTPERLEALVSQPGVAERLIDFLPDELKTKVCSLICMQSEVPADFEQLHLTLLKHE